MTIFLTREDVSRLIDLPAIIEAVEQGHAQLSQGTAVHPRRETVSIPGGGLMVPMVAATPVAAGLKLMTDTPGNADRNLPRQQSLIVLIDTTTGACEAILDGGLVTRLRTAAASAVATRHLSRADSSVLGLIGAGGLAGAHIDAISTVRHIDEVLVWSRSRDTAQRLSDEQAGLGRRVRVAASAEEVARQADVLCTLTPSQHAHVRGAWFRPGLHVNAVGAPPRPTFREIDTEGIVRSTVFSDSREVALGESGEVLIPIGEGAISADDLGVELGDVIIGRHPGRTSTEEVTLFNSVGLGLQDMVTARLLVDRAHATGLGMVLQLQSAS